MIAIDPGDKHCGIARFDPVGWRCVRAATWSPSELIRYLEKTMQRQWVVEEFKLYPWKAQQQAFSQMLTCQLIGVIKYIAAKKGFVTVTWQGADVKKVARGHLRSVGISLLPGDTHSQDAQLHGWYKWLREKGAVGV